MTTVVADTGDIEAVSPAEAHRLHHQSEHRLKALGLADVRRRHRRSDRLGRKRSPATRMPSSPPSPTASRSPSAKRLQARARPRLDRSRRRPVLRHRSLHRKGRQIIKAYEARGIEPRPHPHQARLHLGRHPRRRGAAEGRHRLQPDAALQQGPGHRLRRCRRLPHLALRRPHPRLAQVKATGKDFTAEDDPGVVSVRAIYDYYKSNGINTIVMGASFRNTGEIEALAGCDRLTISPALLEELDASEGALERRLSPDKVSKVSPIKIDEKTFRGRMNEDAMATEKLSEGIRGFAKDLQELRVRVQKALASD
jgi:transaldolase